MDEGYVKFNCTWIKADPLPYNTLRELDAWRNRLYKLGLIGMYDNGIGFGNISIRSSGRTFIISGSATGGLPELDENYYVLVNDYNFLQNSLTCTGPIKASSESLTHAAIYESSPETKAVIHVHHAAMWERLIHNIPTTGENVEYGTPEMADEIKRLFIETKVMQEKILVMGGHYEGIISFGESLDEAGKILLEKFQG